MKDRKGNEVIFGNLLQSEKFMPAGATMFCHGYTEEEEGEEGRVILAQQRSGELPINLTQEELLNSQWVVTGFKE